MHTSYNPLRLSASSLKVRAKSSLEHVYSTRAWGPSSLHDTSVIQFREQPSLEEASIFRPRHCDDDASNNTSPLARQQAPDIAVG